MRMTDRFSLPIFGGTLILLMLSPTASTQGDLVIDVGQGGLIGLPGVNVTAGDQVTLDLYITQTGNTTRLNHEATSINVAEVELTISDGAGMVFSEYTFGDYFADDIGLTQMSTERDMLFFSVGSTKDADPDLGGEIPGVLASEDGVDDNALRLGSFTLEIDPLAHGSHTIDLVGGEFAGFSSTTTPDTGLSGVPLTANSVVINVAPVPEPESFFSLALGALGVLLVLRRRRSARC